MNRGFFSAVSGLSAARIGLTVTGHNMANVNSEGYVRQQSIQRDFAYQSVGSRLQVGMGADISALRQIRDIYLDKSYRAEVGRAAFHNTLYRTGNEIENIYGELESAYSSQNIMQDVWNSINELSMHPSGVETRSNFISTMVSYITKMNNVQERLVKEQLNLNNDVKEMVTRINQLTTRINQLNYEIPIMEASGQRANDYRDERNLCVDELSQLIKIDYSENIKGEVVISTNGQELIANGRANTIGLRYTGPSSSLVEPVFTSSPTILDYDPTYKNAETLFSYTSVGSEYGNDYGALFGTLVARGLYPTNYASLQTQLFDGRGIDPYEADIGMTLAPMPNWQGFPQRPSFPMLPPGINKPDSTDTNLYKSGVHERQYKEDYSNYLAKVEEYSQELQQYFDDMEVYKNTVEQYVADNIGPTGSPLNAAEKRAINNYMAELTGQVATAKGDYDKFASELSQLKEDFNDFRQNHRFYATFNATQCVIPKAKREMDLLFNYVVNLVNDTLNGIDLEGNTGVAIFTERVSGIGLTMGNVEVNPALLERDGYNKLGLSDSVDPDRDDGIKISELLAKWKEEADVFEPIDRAYNMNIDDSYRFVINNLGSMTGKALSYYQAQADLVNELDNKRMTISGVSLDEELSNMMIYQHAYNSASRIVNVIDSMIDRIINGTGRSGL